MRTGIFLLILALLFALAWLKLHKVKVDDGVQWDSQRYYERPNCSIRNWEAREFRM